MVLAWEKRLALKHFSKDAARAPYVNLHVVLLPSEHDLWRPVVPRGDVAGHLWVLYTRQSEVADLQVTVLVDQNVARLQVAMHHASRVDVFQSSLLYISKCSLCSRCSSTYEDLVKEVLDELLFKRSRGEEAVKIGAEQLGDEIAKTECKQLAEIDQVLNVHVFQRRDEDVAETDDLRGRQRLSFP